ncbi:hypothetical protein [Umezawaea sp.]|uniref:hypothetical protein n=1 Tax=Umezawaea sp. TaxID=1955258 RepID=UPI002ED2DCA2
MAPTSVTRTPVMADRPLPDDCELIVPVEQVAQALGRELPKPTEIIGIAEPSIARTGKIDCYHGIPAGKPLSDALLVIGVSTYADDVSAQQRVTESVEAERQAGAAVADVPVAKQRGTLLTSPQELLLIGSIGKSTFVVRARADLLPAEQLGQVLTGFAVQSMTQPIS